MPLAELQCPYCYITISVPTPSSATRFEHECPSCCNTMRIEVEPDAESGDGVRAFTI